jgi:hypothetical protein
MYTVHCISLSSLVFWLRPTLLSTPGGVLGSGLRLKLGGRYYFHVTGASKTSESSTLWNSDLRRDSPNNLRRFLSFFLSSERNASAGSFAARRSHRPRNRQGRAGIPKASNNDGPERRASRYALVFPKDSACFSPAVDGHGRAAAGPGGPSHSARRGGRRKETTSQSNICADRRPHSIPQEI